MTLKLTVNYLNNRDITLFTIRNVNKT